MRFVYALVAVMLWALLVVVILGNKTAEISIDVLVLSFALIAAGALAGGDGRR